MATFDINDVARRVQYTSTGQTGPFNFTFQVNASSELLVYIDDTVKTETTHYTVSLNADGTGSVTFGTATTSGELITIIGDQPLSRTTVFQVGQVNQPTTLETEFDNTLIRQQQIKEITDRSIQLKPSTGRTVTGSGTSGPLYFPYDTTVANNADRVLKFDSNGTSLELGSTTTNIDALAAIASDITTVSGISSNVTTVAGIASDVTSVASNASNINTVATNIANVNTVAGISSDVTAVAAIDTEIAALSGVSAADLSTVAGIASEISTVSGIDTEITTVSGISANVTTVAGDSTNIGTVAGISGNITTVAGISGNVTTVAGISSDVSTVAGISANVTTVAGDTTNIGTVASNITNVNTVATNISGVNSFGERYRVSASAPTTSLDVGDLYYDTTDDIMKVYGSSGWQNAGSSVNGTSARFQYDVSTSTTTITGADKNGETLAYDAGYVDVYLNGVKMVNGTDVTVTSGTSVVFATAIGTSGTDTVDIIAYGTFDVAAISTTSITSGTLGTARGGTGLASLGSADEVLQMNSGGTALEYGKVDTANIEDGAITAVKLNVSGVGTAGQVLQSDGDGSFTWVDTADPFTPTTVSGTTPSLDLGSYNFFSQGNLSGNTTLSFANTPTSKRFAYDFVQNGAFTEQASVIDGTYVHADLSVSSASPSTFYNAVSRANMYNWTMKSDGTKFYFAPSGSPYTLYAFDLSTAWDLSTATYNSESASLQIYPYLSSEFSSDGTKYFQQNGSNLGWETYTLSTAWDISTMSYTRVKSTGWPLNGGGWTWSSDGTKLYNWTFATSGGGVSMYTCSTAYDTSTAGSATTRSYSSMGLYGSFTGSDGFSQMAVSEDGTKIAAHVYGYSSNVMALVALTMSTPYDISTATMDTNGYTTVGTNTINKLQYFPNGDVGFGYYVLQLGTNSTINIYDARSYSPYTLTLPASVQNSDYATDQSTLDANSRTDRRLYEFVTTDGGTNVWLVGNTKYDDN